VTCDFRVIGEGDEDFEAVKALGNQLTSVCSEFDVDHVITALANTVGDHFLKVRQECRGRAWELFATMVSNHMDTIADGGNK